MRSIQFDKFTSKTIIRERKSASSLSTRQMSVNIIAPRQSIMQSEKRQRQEDSFILMHPDDEVTKLRKNLQSAVTTAVQQRLDNVKTKEEIGTFAHYKNFIENKNKLLDREIACLKQENNKLQSKIRSLTNEIKCKDELSNLYEKKIEGLEREISNSSEYIFEIDRLKKTVSDIDALKQRIMIVENQIRQQKVAKNEAQGRNVRLQKQKQGLKMQLMKVKPREQELREKIAYLQRVNLDLQRKMEDYNRRENEYIKQITALKLSLTKMTNDRNKFRDLYEQTDENLKQKIVDLNVANQKIIQKSNSIQKLKVQIESLNKTMRQNSEQLERKIKFFKFQGEENEKLLKHNKLLQAQQGELRKVIEDYVKVAEEVNIVLTRRVQQINRLQLINKEYQNQLKLSEQKFSKFDKLLEEGTQRGNNEIRDNFYAHIRSNNEMIIQIKEMKIEFEEKFLIYGEERDILNRNIQNRNLSLPNDQNQYESIFHEKTESILLLSNSNDQLLKIKKDLEQRIEDLLHQIEQERKEAHLFKLKVADLIRVKKELEEAKKTMQRYQEMIDEQKLTNVDLQEQMAALRERMSVLADKNFTLDLQNRNLELVIREKDEIMKQLDVEVLEAKKAKNQKNAHLINDSIQRMENGVKSLAFYFNCAFCDQLPTTPITLALCGHTYCTKCKEAYAESCYECDTGIPIEKCFQNKFLKEASGKYKFLTMVISQLRTNFQKN